MGIAPKIVPLAPNSAPKNAINPGEGFASGTRVESRKLSSWKEIASYLNRDVRTAQRWEKQEELPVRRLLHAQRGSVFAYTADLDDWIEARTAPAAAQPAEGRPDGLPRPSFARAAIPLLALTLLAAVVLNPVVRPPRPAPRTPANAPVSQVAHEAYMRGSYYFHRNTAEDVAASAKYFERAIQASPNYSAAYAGLALTHLMLRALNANPSAEIARSHQLAERAVALDPDLAEAHDALGMVLAYGDWNWLGAEEEFRQALGLNPGLAQAHSDYSQLEALFGREDIAIAEAKRARELEPLSAAIESNLSWDYYWAHRFEEAIAASREMLASEPAYLIARSCIIRSLIVQNKFAEAREELAADVHVRGENPADYGLNEGSPENAVRNYFERHLAQQRALYEQQKTGPFMIAIDLAALRRKDELLECLEQAVNRREGVSLVVNVEPLFDPYRSDPRFIKIARTTGLPSPSTAALLTQLRETARAKSTGGPETAARAN